MIPEAKENPNKLKSGKSLIMKDQTELNSKNINNNYINKIVKHAKNTSRKSFDKLCSSNNLKSLNSNHEDDNFSSSENQNVKKLSNERVKKVGSGLIKKNASIKNNILSLFKINEKEAQKERIEKEMKFFRSITNNKNF